MAEAQRALLACIGDIARRRQPGIELAEQLAAAALAQRCLELEGEVEMVFERALGAPGDKIELIDPRRFRLLERVLDQRLVDDRQHLLWHRLGRRENAGAETGHRKNRLADGSLHLPPPAPRQCPGANACTPDLFNPMHCFASRPAAASTRRRGRG